MDHASLRRDSVRQHGDRIRNIQRQHGGAVDAEEAAETKADEAQDKRMIKRAVGEHDTQLHPGHHTKLKLRHGGTTEGGSERRRLDRPGRKRAAGGMVDDEKPADPAAAAMSRAINAQTLDKANAAPAQMARGGRKGKGKAGAVNVIVATGGGQGPRPVPVPVPVPVGARPPMMPPGGGAPPPGAGGPPTLPPAVTGGGPPMMGLAARPPMPGAGPGMPPIRADGGKITVGAQSALGRMQKAKMPVVSENANPD